MNSFKLFLHRLKRNHFISRSPHPAIPFLIACAFFLLSFFPSSLASTAELLSAITFIFAVIHLTIYKILTH